jgi:hypothetical protein
VAAYRTLIKLPRFPLWLMAQSDHPAQDED